jgi:hypothetical protein
MAATSAAMFKVLARTSIATSTTAKPRGITRQMLAASPSPVSQPMRALTIWMPIISGVVNASVHSMPAPNWAPACE